MRKSERDMQQNKKIKILVADDHKMMCEGLSNLFKNQLDFDVVGEALNGREAVRLYKKYLPDVVIMDIMMPDLNGIDATKQIKLFQPSAKIIVLSMHSERRFVTEMLEAGAIGYILKDNAFSELPKAVMSVLESKVYLSPEIGSVVLTEYLSQKGGKSQNDQVAGVNLTLREREILQLIAEGKSTKEIASNLFISVKTVETHRKKIMDKLKVNSIAELTKIAIREGLTSV